ncbi:leucine--tRNA ligase, chloroplastic/mitochondrial-like [Camellia sinensis]|uniref:leucine--tRNA ligase, chloroplastic/mitochondrial-like n=1 Tax=Camellia sinensis TaxID=4442 RepID=UPI0010362C84|nr:leucine--tRNA ligase, chloroplastic/mitochondrial-like [Camellia sinensis]
MCNLTEGKTSSNARSAHTDNSYGTGTIMAVPAHDMHDHEFALKYDIPICWVVMPDGGSSGDSERPYSGEAISVNSSSPILGLDINGLPSKEAASKVIEWVEKIGNGNKKVNYKLRDWLFALQRYWGEPIPVVFLKDTGEGAPLPESELPLALPELDDFTPTGTGEPPLSKAVSWVVTTDPLSGKPARRETNTMPQWAGSCWEDELNRKENLRVKHGDARRDIGHRDIEGEKFIYHSNLSQSEEMESPIGSLWHWCSNSNQGIIRGEVQLLGHKTLLMCSESIIKKEYLMKKHHQERIPDEKLVETRLLFLVFGIEGVHRFLGTVWRLIVGSSLPNGTFRDGTVAIDKEPLLEQLRFLHKCIDNVTEEIEGTRFNTGISAMMEFINAAYKWDKLLRSAIESFVLLLSPYAPHIAEELWSRLGHSNSLAYEPFPKADPVYRKESTVVLPIQINGKTRGTIQVEETCTENDAFKLASIDQKLSKYLDCRNVRKKSYVPGKILNVILEPQNIKAGIQ